MLVEPSDFSKLRQGELENLFQVKLKKQLIIIICTFLFVLNSLGQFNFRGGSFSYVKSKSFSFAKSCLIEKLYKDSLPITAQKSNSIFLKKDFFGSFGGGVGNEYIFGIKGSIIKPFSLRKETEIPKYGFYPYNFYVSIDANFFALFAGWGGIGINAGFTIKNFTIDNSIVKFGASAQKGVGKSMTTYNPKLGIRIGEWWIKAGPSFLIGGSKAIFPDWIKIGNYNYNFEVNYLITS